MGESLHDFFLRTGRAAVLEQWDPHGQRRADPGRPFLRQRPAGVVALRAGPSLEGAGPGPGGGLRLSGVRQPGGAGRRE